MSDSSDTRQEILNFIIKHTSEKGYSPSYREIVRGTRVASTSVVAYHLDRLEEQGLITRADKTSRTVRAT